MLSYRRFNLLRASLVLALIVGIVAIFAQPLALAHTGKPVSGNGVVPIFKEGNPSCKDLGYAYSLKFDYPEKSPGTYPLGTGEVTWSTDGTYVNWSSTFGVDAVIVKGGPNANVYQYSPESFGDTGLASPINENTGKPYGLSHVDFCYDYELEVTKDAQTSFTRTYTWTIDKSVAPEEWNLFTGDSGTSQYTVAVEKTVTDSDWAVAGTITIYNPDPSNPAKITGVSDVVSPDINATVNCGVTFPYILAAGKTLECSYSANLPNGDNRTNTASVTTFGLSLVGGGSGTAAVDFGKATINEVGYSSINVDDTNGGSWTFSDSGSVSYTKTFACDADAGTHKNTATIRETGQSDDVSVTVNCYALKVTKDASTSFTRTYYWTIDKWADQSARTLSIGQQFLVNYWVKVDATYTDSDWAVSGKIWVKNPAPIDATINGVSDVVSPDIAAMVDCGVTFPYELAAGGTLECSYSASLPDASSRTNTATATLQNYDYDKDGNGTASGTTEFSGTAEVDFSNATMTEVDECIAVTDTYAGSLGTVCYGVDTLPKTFQYSRWIGPYDTCGDYTVENTASFVANDTGATGSDSWTVTVHVPCPGGCTLTPGYWKTHSKYGPAPYDDTWALIGEDTPFFLSGQSWYRVLWTPPAGGNAYYILAHQYIAAKLNILNGAASTPQVDAALAWATSFFNTYKPTDKLSKTVRADAIKYAELLDQYNNGYIGPGHCSE